jgi:ATP-dependent DNA ligase
MPDFHRLLGDGNATACLYAFDLLEVDSEDLLPVPLQDRTGEARRSPPGRA